MKRIQGQGEGSRVEEPLKPLCNKSTPTPTGSPVWCQPGAWCWLFKWCPYKSQFVKLHSNEQRWAAPEEGGGQPLRSGVWRRTGDWVGAPKLKISHFYLIKSSYQGIMLVSYYPLAIPKHTSAVSTFGPAFKEGITSHPDKHCRGKRSKERAPRRRQLSGDKS